MSKYLKAQLEAIGEFIAEDPRGRITIDGPRDSDGAVLVTRKTRDSQYHHLIGRKGLRVNLVPGDLEALDGFKSYWEGPRG